MESLVALEVNHGRVVTMVRISVCFSGRVRALMTRAVVSYTLYAELRRKHRVVYGWYVFSALLTSGICLAIIVHIPDLK